MRTGPPDAAPVLLWIGLRPARGAPVEVVQAASAVEGRGLVGDHQHQGGLRPWRHREVTLVFEEDRLAAQALLRRPVPAALLRRNLLLSGAAPAAWDRGTRLRLGTVLLELTGPVPPCRRMDRAMGRGARQALCGRGGLAARVRESGCFALGDLLVPA